MTPDKPECCAIARKFGQEYWDGDRKYGYGGFHYDGRYRNLAQSLIKHYNLKNGNRILDIGCGKGFLLYEIRRLKYDMKIQGVDISEYAQKHSKLDRIDHWVNDCRNLPFKDKVFDFTYSINVFHNLCYADLKKAIREMVRVSNGNSYICVESYRNDRELMNLQAWALTCLSFYSPDDWKQILCDNGYSGDVEFVYFG
jgi:protein-L-isoaspartate(D-aspartate) O-methyltransferase